MIAHLPFPRSATLSPQSGVAVAPSAVSAPSAGGASLFDRRHHGGGGYVVELSRTPGNEASHSRTAERIETDG